MLNRWKRSEAEEYGSGLGACVYVSRLIGADPNLVLHGGGNTSVKDSFEDVGGRCVEALYVKGSGFDLATIEASGFTPLSLTRLCYLLTLEALDDPDMVKALSTSSLEAAAPRPSVETLMHAAIPSRFVLHSHADAVLTLCSAGAPDSRVREALGEDIEVLPYIMPGFGLAQAVRRAIEAHPKAATGSIVLLHHGLVTYGDSAEAAYERHIELVTRAEEYLERLAPLPDFASARPLSPTDPLEMAQLRKRVSVAAGHPVVLMRHTDDVVRWFIEHIDLEGVARRGPLTPDHVTRTKPMPLVGRDVDGYLADYQAYYERYRERARTPLTRLDPAPRVILDRDMGMLTVGRHPGEAIAAADIFRHTMPVMVQAEALGGYSPPSLDHIFDVEYWQLQQAKLAAEDGPEFTGEVAIVTGAASGIGRACAEVLLEKGAAVVGIDAAPSITTAFQGTSWLGLQADVTDRAAMAAAMRAGVERFGGVDMTVVSAGVFGKPTPIAQLDQALWDPVIAVNVTAVANLMTAVYALLREAPRGGRVVIIGSKNVPAPGYGAAAYSSSKAAVTQLARVAALEWAPDGIRVNLVHPDAVFDTGLWVPELLAQRAARYGMTIEQYRRRNLLGKDVTSRAVGLLVADMCGENFGVTTGAQVPIDGGNERVI
jgi:rhamnose utilization protein RhaD (predicted bifunctional aldolase and dehydrogenase)/NAD(P)-dependent dehydrogenase (short-subunit alcohol dehydrogenase family)